MKRIRAIAITLTLATVAFAAQQWFEATTVSAQTKESVFVNLTSDEPQRVTMALNFASRLLQGGSKVTLFLNVDGVRLGSTKFPNLVEQRTALSTFMKAGGGVVICAHCMQVRNVVAADLMPGLTLGGEGAAMQAFLASPRSISY